MGVAIAYTCNSCATRAEVAVDTLQPDIAQHAPDGWMVREYDDGHQPRITALCPLSAKRFAG